MPFVFDLFYSNRLHLKMNYEGESSSTLTDEPEAIEAVVSYLSEEIGDVVELEECVTQGVDECISTKNFPCGLCSKICKSKGGLTLHTRAKDSEKMAVLKSVSLMTPVIGIRAIAVRCWLYHCQNVSQR